MNRIVVAFALSLFALTAACETKDLPSAKNELTLSPVPNTKAGVRDPSVKPLPAPGTKVGGIADDGIKPMPMAPARGGIADDGVKPVPHKP